MAHNNNYSTADHLRLPSIRSIGVYPASNTNSNNNNNNASVDYAQQQQQQVQPQVRYSEEYYSQGNREMGYYGHDPSNASNTTTASTGAPAHPSHSSSTNSTSNSGSGPNVSPYRRPRTLTSNLNHHGTMNNAKYDNNHAHAHHHSSIATASGSGAGSSASVSAANSGSTTTGVAAGQSNRSSSYNSTYPGHLSYPNYYNTQRGSAAPTTTTTTAAAGSTGANTGATSWYYAQNQNSSHSQSQTLPQSQQPTASPVLQHKPNSMHPQYAHNASPSQSPVQQQQQQQQYYQQPPAQGQNQSSYSQSTMHGHSNPVPHQSQSQQQNNNTRSPRFQSMHHPPPSSSSLHPSGGVYSTTSNNDSPTTTATHHGQQHMTIPSMNSSSSLTGGNGSAPAPIPASPAPTSTNTGLIQNLEEDANRAAAEGMHINKILEHCEILRTFADHYAHQAQAEGSPSSNSATPPANTTSAGNPGGPTPPEITEMAQRANIVFKLVDQMRKSAGVNVNIPGFSSIAAGGGGMAMDEDSLYKKKRGWGDEDGSGNIGDDIESLAYHDMAHIRNKRAQGVGNNTAPGGNAKAKYRKRSRATPPGKCHSCNIRETPEWRRGPDGARTLCNACGLHYAKLIRKRDKNVGSGNVDLPPISVEMLRASTRADSAKHHIANINVSGSISLSGIGGTSSVSGTSGSGTTGSGLGGPPGSAASPSGTGSSEMTEIALQPIGAPPSHSATASSSGVTLSPVSSSNVSLTGPGRSNSGGGGGSGGGLQQHWSSSSAPTMYRYSGPEPSGGGGTGSSAYHSHSSAHSSNSHHPHVHSLPPPPHHQALHLPHPLQRSGGGYDGYSTSLMRTSAPVGGDGRGSPGV